MSTNQLDDLQRQALAALLEIAAQLRNVNDSLSYITQCVDPETFVKRIDQADAQNALLLRLAIAIEGLDQGR